MFFDFLLLNNKNYTFSVLISDLVHFQSLNINQVFVFLTLTGFCFLFLLFHDLFMCASALKRSWNFIFRDQ